MNLSFHAEFLRCGLYFPVTGSSSDLPAAQRNPGTELPVVQAGLHRLILLAMIVFFALPAMGRSLDFGVPPTKDSIKVSGYITTFLNQQGFVLDRMTAVYIQHDTVFVGVDSYEDLWYWDRVEVTASASGDALIANRVKLLDHGDPGDGDQVSFDAVFESLLDSESFRTASGETVRVDQSTEYENISGIADLSPGDRIHISGEEQNGETLAAFVGRTGGGGGGGSEAEDYLVAFLAPDRFLLGDGTEVQTSSSTVYYGVWCLADLYPGDLISIHLGSDGIAEEIILEEEASEYYFSATVGEILSSVRMLLDDSTEVWTDIRTEYWGISSLTELRPGQNVTLDGAWWNGIFLAWNIEAQTTDETYVEEFVAEVSAAGGYFDLEDGRRVFVDPNTVFVGITGLVQLRSGDLVGVTGSQQGDTIQASQVQILEDPGNWTWISGVVEVLIDGNSFRLESGLLIQTTPETQLLDLEQVSDLRPGDRIEAMGDLEGTTLSAEWLSYLGSTAQLETITASVAFLNPPDLFTLDDTTIVRVDEDTVWEGLSGYSALESGDRVEVEGYANDGGWMQENWDFLAVRVHFVESSTGERISRQGWVQNLIPPRSVLLSDQTRLDIREDANLQNFNQLSELEPGDELWIEGFTTTDPEVLDVTKLILMQRAGSPVDFLSEITSVSIWNHTFFVANGYEIMVDDSTVFVGFSGLEDVRVGQNVSVSGLAGTDPMSPLVVIADRVENKSTDGGGGDDEGGGLRTTVEGVISELVAPDHFILDNGWDIRITEYTAWRGELGGYGDLFVGLPLRSEISIDQGVLITAVWVEDMGGLGARIEEIEGKIIQANPESSSFFLDGGETIIFNEYSEIDGDAASVEDIMVGMVIDAMAVNLGDGTFNILSAQLTLIPDDVGSLGFDAGPVREALVVLSPGGMASEVAGRHAATVAGTLPGLLVFLFQWDEEIGLEELQSLLDDPGVDVIEPNRAFSDPESDPDSIRRRAIAIDRSPTSDKFNDQEALHATKLAQAHERNHGEETIVAIIDTGIDPLHPLLRNRIASGGYDFVDQDEQAWETRNGIDEDLDGEIDEAAGHGTFVAGLVLLAAPATKILPYRVLNDDGRGTTFAICEAVLLAMDRGVDIINMSFAYPERSHVLDRILMEASQRGIVLVSGAGNTATTELPFPAGDNRVLAVAAIENSGRIAEFSNRGSLVTLGAPGVNVYSAGLDSAFGNWSGTSMAAPLVSGVVALLRSANPNLTPMQIRDALIQGAADGVAEDDLAYILDAAAALDLIPDSP